MQKIAVLLSLLGSISLFGQESESSPLLRGVVLVDDASKIKEDPDLIEGIRFDGVLANSMLRQELVPLLSTLPLTADGAKELCDAIASHYRSQEDLKVAVSVPEQDFHEGVAQVVVMHERIGRLNIKNNQYTKPETLKKWVRLDTTDAINEKVLAQDVGWMNTNPFRTVNIAYEPGEKAGITNVDLVVSDKKSWKISSGVDNTGTNPVGPLRIFGKLEVNDFIFTDHTLNVQGTTADHYNELQSYTLQYNAPLPWRNSIRLLGTYAETSPYRANYPQKHRQTYQASGRYVVPHWFGSNPWVDQMTVEAGFDFKGTNTNVLYENNPLPVDKKLAYVGQFVGSLNAVRNRNGGKLSGSLDLIGSPGEMLPNQTEGDFNNLRAGATPQYFYSRLSLSLDQKLPQKWKLFVQARGQFSLATLIPSEQFALGGYNTVRGYDEKAVNGDRAICGNLELKTPEMPIAKLWFPKVADSLVFVGFVDAGYGRYNQFVTDTPESQSLIGVGSGVRYNVASYFSSRFDVGFPLIEVAKDSGGAHLHFNAIFSF